MEQKDLLITLFAVWLIYINSFKNNAEYFENEPSQLGGFDLRNVKTMTFFKNLHTTGNRTNPIPQLNCVEGNACGKSGLIDSVQCNNAGTNENDDVQWECKTELPNNLSLGKTNLNCEGLKNDKDKIKFKNSCGLEYSLNSNYENNNNNSYSNNWIWVLLCFVFLILCIVLIKSRGPYGYAGVGSYPYPYPYYSPIFYPSYPSYGYGSPYGSSISHSSPSYSGFSSSTGFGSTRTR